jgi:hypothetical protein
MLVVAGASAGGTAASTAGTQATQTNTVSHLLVPHGCDLNCGDWYVAIPYD